MVPTRTRQANIPTTPESSRTRTFGTTLSIAADVRESTTGKMRERCCPNPLPAADALRLIFDDETVRAALDEAAFGLH